MKQKLREMKNFLILWPTQSLSALGSAMTNYALTLWLFETTGSALQTALLSVCSYAPYVLMSLFAGALSDRWDKKKILLVSDALAACCSAAVLVLLQGDLLHPAHLYLLNAVNGLMNTVQQPAADVAMTLITPKEEYQRTSGLRSFSGALVTVLHPVFATALFASVGIEGVLLTDLLTFVAAFFPLLFFVRIPAVYSEKEGNAAPRAVFADMRDGLAYLRQNRLLLLLIFFLAAVNFAASSFDAVLPPYVLSHPNGGKAALGAVSAAAGIASLVGSLLVTVLPAPKNRVRTVWRTVLYSFGPECFLLAFARTPGWWCAAQLLGWLPIPLMNANLDVILRSTVPPEMQGRVYACRNALQFCTIPVGTFLGGLAVDRLAGPLAAAGPESVWVKRFGAGTSSAAALVLCLLGVLGLGICLFFRGRLKGYTFSDTAEKRA